MLQAMFVMQIPGFCVGRTDGADCHTHHVLLAHHVLLDGKDVLDRRAVF